MLESSGQGRSFTKVLRYFCFFAPYLPPCQGSLDTLRQLKKDITEARKGMECGMSLREFSDLQEGDLIQIYDNVEKPGVI